MRPSRKPVHICLTARPSRHSASEAAMVSNSDSTCALSGPWSQYSQGSVNVRFRQNRAAQLWMRRDQFGEQQAAAIARAGALRAALFALWAAAANEAHLFETTAQEEHRGGIPIGVTDHAHLKLFREPCLVGAEAVGGVQLLAQGLA